MKRTLIVSAGIGKSETEHLSFYYNDIVKVEKNPLLPPPVSDHPDMQVLKLYDCFVIAENFAECSPEAFAAIERSKLLMISTVNKLGNEYPHDCLLNVKLIGNRLLCRSDIIDPSVRRICMNNKLELLGVRQGYAACSTLVLSPVCAVTADATIASVLTKVGCDVLKLAPGGIVISKYDYGFIGGASFYDALINTVFFFGTPPEKMREALEFFLKRHSVSFVYLSKQPLADFGGGVIIESAD